MKKVKIIIDSCGDLRSDLLEKYDIDFAKMCTVHEGVSTPALITWSAEEAHEFYSSIRAGKRITTAQVPVEEFMRIFEEYLKQDMDIVYVACASKQSGSVNTAAVVKAKLEKEYPDSYIACIDSQNTSVGIGMLAIRAAELAAEGKSAKEIEEEILAIRKTVLQYVTVHSLDALRRAGRVKASAAFFGNLMGVKPILIADADGAQAAYKKVKGRATSFREIVALLKEHIVDPEKQTVYVAHSDCSKEEVEAVVSMVKAEINCKDVVVSYINPIVGASVGPDTIGVWAFGDEVTFRAGDTK